MENLLYSFQPKNYKDLTLFINILLSDERILKGQASSILGNYFDGCFYDVYTQSTPLYIVFCTNTPKTKKTSSIIEIYDNFNGILKINM